MIKETWKAIGTLKKEIASEKRKAAEVLSKRRVSRFEFIELAGQIKSRPNRITSKEIVTHYHHIQFASAILLIYSNFVC